MQNIIPPVDRQLLRNELTEDKFLRHSNKLHNQLYLVDAHNSPNVMLEIGRLREQSFREAGGGTGKEVDIDDFDTAEKPFQQLVLWDPDDQEIIAGYRLLMCKDAPVGDDGKIVSATAHLFDLSDRFYRDFLPTTMELGRSFIQPKYQRGVSKKGLFSLDNLWDGLGAVVLLNPDIRYLFGKVTMYPQYNREARNILMAFLYTFFPDNESLVVPEVRLITPDEWAPYTEMFEGKEYKEAFTVLNREVRDRGEVIPPLINTYMSLSSTMKTFGTALNNSFGRVEETGILVTIADIYEARKERHIDSYYNFREYTGPEVKFKP